VKHITLVIGKGTETLRLCTY